MDFRFRDHVSITFQVSYARIRLFFSLCRGTDRECKPGRRCDTRCQSQNRETAGVRSEYMQDTTTELHIIQLFTCTVFGWEEFERKKRSEAGLNDRHRHKDGCGLNRLNYRA